MATRLSNKKKHTLDSDEEDESENVRTMRDEDIEGQEECYVDFEDGMRFTPFHMKDELEEGKFDENGTYIFNKDNEIKDGWIDGVNWSQVKEMEKVLKMKEKETKEKAEVEEEIDEVTIMKSMINIMLPKETVTKAIKRLDKTGGAVGAWQKKKRPRTETEGMQNHEKSRQQLSDLIGYADRLLSKGLIDIYQETYEGLQFKLSEKSKPIVAADDVDIFCSDDLKANASKPKSPDVQWEFKWTDDGDAEVYGPYSSQQMMAWKKDGYFKDGVLVRKLEEGNKAFYTSKRIDFELYV